MKHSLSFRINLTFWGACALLLLLFSSLFLSFEKHQIRIQIHQSKIFLDALFQQKHGQLANEIFAGHYEALQQALVELKSVQDVDAVYIFNKEGHIIERVGQVPNVRLSRQTLNKLQQNPLFEELKHENQNYLTYTAPIEMIGERQGYFSIIYNLSNLSQTTHQRMVFILLVFTGLLLILSFILHLMLTRLVVNPVSTIREALDHVMQGQLGKQVTLARKGEIGEMAASFNAMSTQLKEQQHRLLQSMSLRDSYSKQLEETNRKLAQLNIDLESIVEKRTLELKTSNEKLRKQIKESVRNDQAKRALEARLARSQKMEALGLLAGGVAHDLNNVLSGIVSYPELILMDMDKNNPYHKMIKGIQKSGHKAAEIVQDLLALARRGVPQSKVLNLNKEIIKDYLASPEFNKLQFNHKNVAIDTRLDPNVMNIKGSLVHLRKALMNLVANAAEAQPEGGRILISTENRYVDLPISGYDEVIEGDYVVLGVKDEGSGINPQDLGRIFEPFYTKKVMGTSGTGLGMAVVWGTIQDHNGYINVTSQINEGTEFDLFFPVTREEVELTDEKIDTETFMGNGETVLVIDDIQEQRNIASALLKRLNYEVYAVDSGKAAIAFLQKQKADILILDMIMEPGIDGLQTYQESIEIHPGQKAIIASGYAENERVKKAQTLGAGVYIRKPYTLEKIGLAIRKELDR